MPSNGTRVGTRAGGPRALVATLASLLALGTMSALAAPTQVERREACERRGITRVLELRENPDGSLPCEVVYLKPDEDRSARVMWLARTDRGFCAARYEEFLVKLESKLAWSCEPSATETATAMDPPGSAASDSAAPDIAAPDSAASDPEPPEPPPALASEPAAATPGRESAPSLARAMPPRSASGDAGDEPDRLAELRALVPPGPYAAVPTPGRPSDVPVPPVCPPGGSLSWDVRDRRRPVLELGPGAELALRLPAAALDETSVLEADPDVRPEPGATRELRALSLVPTTSTSASRVIEIRVAPRGPGSGAESPSDCRYALGDG